MPYVDPGAVTTGTTITSTWGNAVRNALQFFANPPTCRVYHNATQSVANATNVALAFNSEREDTDTMHDTVTTNTRITIKTAGRYVVIGHAGFAANATGKRTLLIRKNGSVNLAEQDTLNLGAGEGVGLTISTAALCAVNDYFELIAYQTSGGALNIFADDATTGQALCDFEAVWVGLG